jgi:hypothetical protein
MSRISRALRNTPSSISMVHFLVAVFCCQKATTTTSAAWPASTMSFGTVAALRQAPAPGGVLVILASTAEHADRLRGRPGCGTDQRGGEAGGRGLGDGQNDPHRPRACAATGAGAGQAGPNDARPDQERGGAAAGVCRSPPAVLAARAGVPPQYPSLKAGRGLSREAEGGGIRTGSYSPPGSAHPRCHALGKVWEQPVSSKVIGLPDEHGDPSDLIRLPVQPEQTYSYTSR